MIMLSLLILSPEREIDDKIKQPLGRDHRIYLARRLRDRRERGVRFVEQSSLGVPSWRVQDGSVRPQSRRLHNCFQSAYLRVAAASDNCGEAAVKRMCGSKLHSAFYLDRSYKGSYAS